MTAARRDTVEIGMVVGRDGKFHLETRASTYSLATLADSARDGQLHARRAGR